VKVSADAAPRRAPTPAEARRDRQKARERFKAGRNAESWFARQLRAVATQVGRLVDGMLGEENAIGNMVSLRLLLDRYAETITPWARSVVERMTAEVGRHDAAAWEKQGKLMGRALGREIRTAPTGEALREYLNEQVGLITSLPRGAAERVHQLTLKGITEGTRADEIVREIRRTGEVTRSRANTIARTEVSRTASALTMVRAKYVGSEYFVWRTALDSDVRPLHKKLEGRAFRWDDPPVSGENGERSLPGAIYNCRCYPEPVLRDVA
jgi:SPP1 gp7 family putative phage head morphogenesis protein